jgi:hypothetical protein
MDQSLRPMSTGEILDRTFSLYKSNFLLFAGISILPAALALIMHLIGFATRMTGGGSGRSSFGSAMSTLTFELLEIFVAYIVGSSIANGAAVYAVYNVHLGKPATIRDSYRKVLQSWFKVIGLVLRVTFIIFGLAGLAATILAFAIFAPLVKMERSDTGTSYIGVFLVLGIALATLIFWIYLYARYALSVPALLLDKTTIRGATRRSRFLSKGGVRRIAQVFILTVIISLAFRYALQAPEMMLSFGRRHFLLAEFWSYAAQFISTAIAGPIGTIAVALIYIDHRIRKEAFDLQLMMEAIQEPNNVSAPV